MHHILKYELVDGASAQLQSDLDQYDLEIVSTAAYTDIMEHTARNFLVVVARERSGGSLVEVAPRQQVSPASAEADVAAFDAWVQGTEPDDFEADLAHMRRDLPA